MELASRATYRGQVTKLAKSALEYLQSDAAKVSETAENLDNVEEELTVLLDRLTAAYESLQKANNDVRSFIKADDFEREAETIADYNDKAIGAITRLKQRLNKVRQYQGQGTSMSARVNPVSVSLNEKSSAVKLQKLHPKTFSGDFKDWVPFWEQFRTLIHKNASLSTVDKFNYLQSLLTGKAAATIAGLTPTESCYDVAIALLQEEYGNVENIIDHNMQRLLSIQPVTSKTDAAALRSLYNSVVVATRSLSAVGIPASNYFVMLKGVLLRCLPTELRVDFHLHYNDFTEDSQRKTTLEMEDPDNGEGDANSIASSTDTSLKTIVDKQVKFLKREVESLEKAYEAKPNSSRSQHPSNSKFGKTAVALFTGATNEKACFFLQFFNSWNERML